MSVELFRIDDRLVHGQVVVGWGQPLKIQFIALVDDQIARDELEQDLYRTGVPAGVELYFDSVESGVRHLPDYLADTRRGMVLTGSVDAMRALSEQSGRVEHVNVGGVHAQPGRVERLRYVYLTPAEEQGLKSLGEAGVDVTAQDLPNAAPVSLKAMLAGHSR